MPTIELYVFTDYGNSFYCIYHHLGSQNLQTTLDALRVAEFEKVPTHGEPPKVTVAIQVSAVVFGGEAPAPEQHHQRYFLKGASLEETKAALKAMGASLSSGHLP